MDLNRKEIPYILFLLVFTTIITIIMINFNNQIGVYCSDVYVYLLNSLNFAGIDLGSHSPLYLSPVICFCTSLLFRLGYVDITAIYIVTGVFAIFGMVGFYLLLRYRFNKLLSLTGAILLFSLSLNLLWLANGTLDIPAVGLTVWTSLFFILAVDKNHRYYWLFLLFFILSFFTRFTTILILPALLVYFMGKYDVFKFFDNLLSDREALHERFDSVMNHRKTKRILTAIIVGIILIIVLLVIFCVVTGSFPFLYLVKSFNAGFNTNKYDSAYNTNTWFYILNFLNFLFASKISIGTGFLKMNPASPTSYVVMILTGFGLLTGIINKVKELKETKTVKLQETFKTKNYSLILKIFFTILLILTILTLGKTSSIVSIILLTLDIVILNKLLENQKIGGLKFHLMMLTWFLTYLIAFSLIFVKVNRYILTLMPAFIYFFILAIQFISEKWNYKIKNVNTQQILAILLILVFICSAFTFTSTVNVSQDVKSPLIISNTLKHHDPDYQNKTIAVYNKRPFTWLLMMKPSVVNEHNRGKLYNGTFTYYISNDKRPNLNNYHILKHQGKLYLYERD